VEGGSEILLTIEKADARTRTGDPFITSESSRSGGVCAEWLEVAALQGEDVAIATFHPCSPWAGSRAFGHGLGTENRLKWLCA
jgi:hypothetical protein